MLNTYVPRPIMMKSVLLQSACVSLLLSLSALSYPSMAQETVPAPAQAPVAATPAPAAIAPAVPSQTDPAATPSASTDVAPLAASSTAATPKIEIFTPANPEPLIDFTKYYARQTATVKSGDHQAQLTYFTFAPTVAATPGTQFPLVLVLHEASGQAEAGRFLITESVRNAYPAYIVVPALPTGKRWADPGPLKPAHALPEAVELVKQLIAINPAIDPKKVYVIGCGTGGTGAYGAAQLYSDVFAAAVPIAATWNPHEISNMKNLPIAAFHGVDDMTVPLNFSSDTIAMVQHEGGTAFFTKYENMAHNCSSDRIYNELLWKWLFAQKKAP